MERKIALIGFGEAAGAFAAGGRWQTYAYAFDRKTERTETRHQKWAEYQDQGVIGCGRPETAANGADLVLSLVTADQSVAAAQSVGGALAPGTYYFDGNSVSPETKREAALVVEACGASYVDMAIMAPVLPARLGVPILLSGPKAHDAAAVLARTGFANVQVTSATVGDASAIKMIRSVIVKGIEALAAECLLAADRAGVTQAVLASLDASSKPQSWAERMDYSLDRMMAHGLRRAAEMEEVAKTLEALGIDPAMTRGTIARQREIGLLNMKPPGGLDAKLAAIGTHSREQAA